MEDEMDEIKSDEETLKIVAGIKSMSNEAIMKRLAEHDREVCSRVFVRTGWRRGDLEMYLRPTLDGQPSEIFIRTGTPHGDDLQCAVCGEAHKILDRYAPILHDDGDSSTHQVIGDAADLIGSEAPEPA
jgi:hypothetical protein